MKKLKRGLLQYTATFVLLSITLIAFASEKVEPVKSAIHELGLTGCVVLYDSELKKTHLFGDDLANNEFLPASTFKIPHTLIALETGVVNEGTVFKWDGKERGWFQWNRDLTLADALQYSAIHVYQQIAPKIGEARMQEWINKFDYGNRNIGGPMDLFWVAGDIRTTPNQQIEFLHKMVEGQLPVKSENIEVVKRSLLTVAGGGWIARAKTGRAIRVLPQVGWYVGWIEREQAKPVYFATVLLDGEKGDRIKLPRLDITLLALKEAGLYLDGMVLPYYE